MSPIMPSVESGEGIEREGSSLLYVSDRSGWNPVKELKAVFVTEDQFGTMVPVESGGGTESQLTAMV